MYQHKQIRISGKTYLEHRVIAERVLAHSGVLLPKSSVVHHGDGNPRNNAVGNLVVCPDEAYHKHLHLRMAATKATGDPAKRKCAYCMEWDDIQNMRPFMGSRNYHKRCAAAYQAGRRSRGKEITDAGIRQETAPEAAGD